MHSPGATLPFTALPKKKRSSLFAEPGAFFSNRGHFFGLSSTVKEGEIIRISLWEMDDFTAFTELDEDDEAAENPVPGGTEADRAARLSW